MKKTRNSVIVLVVAFLAIMLVGAKTNGVVINMDSGFGIEYLIFSLISVGLAIVSASYFQTNRRKCAVFLVLSLILPLVAGIATFFVATVFNGIIAAKTDKEVIDWFMAITEPEKECKLDETDE